jgi:hypothetical protein
MPAIAAWILIRQFLRPPVWALVLALLGLGVCVAIVDALTVRLVPSGQ